MADTIKIGNLDISSFKVGGADCSIYLGDVKLYPSEQPSFQGKWLATYTAGTTSSAECDSSSAITENEITLTDLQSVEIEDCVTSIGNKTFRNCTSITSITIPNSVTSIGGSAFEGCSSLTSIDIPSGVTSIGNSAFWDCSSLTSIDIPSGVTSIGGYAFYGCSSLSSCTIGSGVTSISSNAFLNCYSLTSIDIPSGVTNIGSGAFNYCSSLSSITVNATTPPTLANASAFNNTNNCPIYVPAASVNAYKTATNWSTHASRIQAIPSPSFQGKWLATYEDTHTESAQCNSTSAISIYEITLTDLESVEIGDCVTTIDSSAFYSCRSLTSVEIADSVTSISGNAFYNCTSLTSITIPNSVTTIDSNAFLSCSSLSSCTIGSGVTSIGESAFNGCTSLTSITINATTPPSVGWGTFDGSYPIYVPAESVETYKTANVWIYMYASRIQAIP